MGGRGNNSGLGSVLTDESPDFGRPGTYELYRSGDLSAPNGLVFLSASIGESLKYGLVGDLDTVERYQIDIKNPLVVSESSDRDNVIAAWKALHPGEDPKIKTSGLPSKKWEQMDRQNAKALEKSEYDAIIYKKADGSHEVQIPKSSAGSLDLKKKIGRSGVPHYNKDGRWFKNGNEYKYTKGKGWKLIGNKDSGAPKFIKE